MSEESTENLQDASVLHRHIVLLAELAMRATFKLRKDGCRPFSEERWFVDYYTLPASAEKYLKQQPGTPYRIAEEAWVDARQAMFQALCREPPTEMEWLWELTETKTRLWRQFTKDY